MDRYNERLITGKAPFSAYLQIAGSFVLVAIGVFVMFMFPWGIFVLIAGGICAAMTFGNTNIEWEFILTNGDIEVTKIISMKKRKLVKTIGCGDIVAVDKANSDKVKNDLEVKAQLVCYEFLGPDTEEDNCYAIYTNEKGKETVNILDLDEKCVEHLKLYLKQKCLFK